MAQYSPACRAVGAHEGAWVGFGQSCFWIPPLRAGARSSCYAGVRRHPRIQPCIHLEAAEDAAAKVAVAASSASVLLGPA